MGIAKQSSRQSSEEFLQKELSTALAELARAREEIVKLAMELAAIARGQTNTVDMGDMTASSPSDQPSVPSFPTLFPDIEFDEYMEPEQSWPITGEITTSTPPTVGTQHQPVHVTTSDGRVARLDGTGLFVSGQSAAPPTGGVE